jgi:hypothetical protein
MLKKQQRVHFCLVFVLVGVLYGAFVLMNLWNWFVVPTFHLSAIFYWMVFGLALAVNTFYQVFVAGSDVEADLNQERSELMPLQPRINKGIY